jgi:hypothetical protein
MAHNLLLGLEVIMYFDMLLLFLRFFLKLKVD